MKLKPKLSIIRSLLFTYNIENTKDLEREEIIVSKDVNDDKQLAELFDELTKPEYILYNNEERQWYIDTLEHFLNTAETFDSIFYLFDTYFDEEIFDQRQFMRVLLGCLIRYQAEATESI
ncbi:MULTISPECIES: hypothetical protein [unclassified Pseudomonas]|uniref:hypothetical protein n=1 Tax=unclassified Pseudomonas TaxID=196821 RepID=UPI00159FA6FE|nr:MULTISPECIES: hypothetical protein [unclassified Pseudomonas]NWC95899.1 hypothetical protein [Pseudomonas sp. IPO3779]NWD20114.1 hypothetical protein [Pseudomonas sp. IPO3778]